MTNTITLRELCFEDSKAINLLLKNSPDTGRVGAYANYNIPPFTAFQYQNKNTKGVVAETAHGMIVGMGLMSVMQGTFSSKVCSYALLHSLVVHPDYRHQGIASRLTKWRIQRAEEKLGKNAIVVAGIQQDNIHSTAIANKWCNQWLGKVVASLSSTSQKPPQKTKNILVRPIQNQELERVIQAQNEFYQDYTLYKPENQISLQGWLNQTPFETPYRHYRVAVDKQNNILAGMSVVEHYKLTAFNIQQLPLSMKMLNKLLAIVPADGIIKQLSASRIWFAPNQQKAGLYLWQSIRYQWHKECNGIITYFDPRSPLKEIIKTPFWMPRSSTDLAIRTPEYISKKKNFIYYP
jgi:GNAT superfamily N-acetyltransferase